LYSELCAFAAEVQRRLSDLFATEFHSRIGVRHYRVRFEALLSTTVAAIKIDFEDGILSPIAAAEHKTQLDAILSDLSVLRDAGSDEAPWWVLPIISEGSALLGVDINDESALVSQDLFGGLWVGTLDPNSYESISHPIAVFGCPRLFESSPYLAGLLYHEVGHRWVAENEQNLYVEVRSLDSQAITACYSSVNQLAEEAGEDNPLFIDDLKEKFRKDFDETLASHIQELVCDEIGRTIQGIGFDIALVAWFALRQPNDISSSHPSDHSRLSRSSTRLHNFHDKLLSPDEQNRAGDFMAVCDVVVSNAQSRTTKNSISGQIQLLAGATAQRLVDLWLKNAAQSKLQNWRKLALADAALMELWPKAEKQLRNKVPLFELVTWKESLRPLATREILSLAALDHMVNSQINRNVDEAMFSSHVRAAIELSPVTNALLPKAKPASAIGLWNLRSELGNYKDNLVVTPTLDPQGQFSHNAVDLRLGNVFLVTLSHQLGILSARPAAPEEIERPQPPNAFYARRTIAFNEAFVLHPHQFVLAVTLEYIVMPLKHYATVLGRSSWGRLGLTIATATAVNPGYKGRLTLELRNLGETPLELVVGTRIAQLCFVASFESPDEDEAYEAKALSKYKGPVEPEVSKIQLDPDWKLLREFDETPAMNKPKKAEVRKGKKAK
jgi:dCTP deaminase